MLRFIDETLDCLGNALQVQMFHQAPIKPKDWPKTDLVHPGVSNSDGTRHLDRENAHQFFQ